MTIGNRLRPGTRVAALAASLLLAACAAAPKSADTIAARAQARWDLLLAGDYDGAYQFLSPGQRSAMTSLQYQRKLLMRKVGWKSAAYVDSECTEETCNVWILLGIVLVSPVPGVPRYDIEQTIEEQWIRSENQWWYVSD